MYGTPKIAWVHSVLYRTHLTAIFAVIIKEVQLKTVEKPQKICDFSQNEPKNAYLIWHFSSFSPFPLHFSTAAAELFIR